MGITFLTYPQISLSLTTQCPSNTLLMSYFNKKNKYDTHLSSAEQLAQLSKEISGKQEQKEFAALLRANAISAIKEKADAYKKDRDLALSKEDSLRFIYDTAVLYVIRNIDIISTGFTYEELLSLISETPEQDINRNVLSRLNTLCSNTECNGFETDIDPNLNLANYSIRDLIGCGLNLLSPDPLPFSNILKHNKKPSS